jgi:hypothetical protein
MPSRPLIYKKRDISWVIDERFWSTPLAMAMAAAVVLHLPPA